MIDSVPVAAMCKAIRESLGECGGDDLVDVFLEELHARGFVVVPIPKSQEPTPGEPGLMAHSSEMENHR